ncbi:unnamed protein product [Macrosiphum euphorbiae]|uniref:Uncharacterized protein n=1 Tax=Macrosiphum euphorbiae TaxID=13131 RepID=A0AAV0Y8T2_9HEMI|nr:unnamed protein product [Macrosiphum euphorbiae]
MDPPMLPPSIFGIHEDPITYATLRVRPSYPLDHIDGPLDDISNQQSADVNDGNDVNDGPDFFDRDVHSQSQFTTPASCDRATYPLHPTPSRKLKRKLPQSPASPQPFDVNDGPDFFNPISTSTPIQPTYTQHPAPVRDVRRRLF